jgi:hypothetical protein|tara:strand:+ start:696 stop:1106 length:411 start_codon:yes stop_codon:yes gene_type:complete
MKNISRIAILTMVLVLSSCANKFKYFGNDYPETQNAKIYFREADIEKKFEVIGKLYCDFKVNTKDSKVQRIIMDKVKKHGGDGAIFGNLYVNSVGSVSSTVGGSKGFGKRSRVGGSVTSSKDKQKDQMEITVIKFK